MNRLYFGKRLMKTAVAVYATAQICYLLNWPIIFAVIAAIVSIEPTVNASIRRGIIRLPAAAIGAAFAMIFDAFVEFQPLAYTLSALATIYVCQLLRWNDMIVVATLTAVNMLPLTEAHFLIHFFIRVGTTMIGIVVSALVNYFLFPPDYSAELRSLLKSVSSRVLVKANCVLKQQNEPPGVKPIEADVKRMQTLLAYQLSDYRLKKTSCAALREMAQARKTLRTIRLIQLCMETIKESNKKDERNQFRELLAGAVRKLSSLSVYEGEQPSYRSISN